MFKKVKRKMLLILALVVSITSIPLNGVFAEEASHVKVTVVGDGEVVVSDGSGEYNVDEGSSFDEQIRVGTKLRLDFKPSTDLSYKVTINGEEKSNIEDNKYSHKVDKGDIDICVYFLKDGESITSLQESVNANTLQNSVSKDGKETENTTEVKEETKVENPTVTLGTYKNKGVTVNLDETLTEFEKGMIADYRKGITDKEGYRDARKEKAEKTGLIDYCDSDYFLNSSFYKNFTRMLENFGGVSILCRNLVADGSTNSIARTTISQAKASSSLTVITYLHSSYYYDGTESSLVMNGVWTLSNGSLAFCAQAYNSEPPIGDNSVKVYEITNENIIKSLYYGYNGPGDILTDRLGMYGSIVVTNDLVSYAYSGNALATILYNGTYWNSHVRSIWNEIIAKPLPKNYKAYGVRFSGTAISWQGIDKEKQLLVYGESVSAPTPIKGKLQIKKSSANTSITNNSGYYTLEGAQYGVYKDSSATNKVATLTIGSDGVSNEVSLNPGTYYVKEIKAPKGYAIDTKTHSVKVTSDSKTVESYTDYPKSDPVAVLLKKVDAVSGEAVAYGDGTLEGAQYEFKFYKGIYGDGVDPDSKGASHNRRWVMKTDKNGFINFLESYKVSGDDFYLNSLGKPTLPIGTLTVKEIKAPKGYLLDETTYVRKISDSGESSETISSYNIPISKEMADKGTLQISKKTSNTSISNNSEYYSIVGAQYGVYSDSGATNKVATLTIGEGGYSKEISLDVGTYYIKEIKAPKGFALDTTTYNIKVNSAQKTSKEFKDIPKSDVVSLLLKKVDSVTGTSKTSGVDSLKGAQYEFKFYKGLYADGVNPADKGATHNRKWIFETDADGKIYMDKEHKVSGDDFYYNSKNNTALPIGTLVIKEIKAPKGYKLDSTVFIKKIVDDGGNSEVLESYNSPTSKDEPVKGKLQIFKGSALSSITVNNDLYVIKGAQYGVYKDKKASEKVGTLTIGEDGSSNVIELYSGTYYVKETKAPSGYALDTNVYSIKVNSGETVKGEFEDIPKSNEISIALKKVDSKTGTSTVSGYGSLKGAQYEFKFFKGSYANGVNPEDSGVKHNRKWVLETDKNGIIKFSEDYKLSGDEFYVNSAGKPTLPLGTLVVKEIKASNGYHLNSKVHIIKITDDGKTVENLTSYSIPTSKEEPVEIVIKKRVTGTTTMVPGTEFNHVRPNGSEETLVTDEDGQIHLLGLEVGTHQIVEKKTIDGLVVNKNVFEFKVKENGIIQVVTSNLNDLGLSYTAKEEHKGVLLVNNNIKKYSIKLNKFNDKGLSLDGAEFTLYADKNCTEVIATKTTKDGILSFTNLENKVKYYFKETKAPRGYSIPVDSKGNAHVYEVYVNADPVNSVFDFYVDGKKYTVSETKGSIHLEGTKHDRVVAIDVVNYIGMKLPVTGSPWMYPIVGLGVCIMFGGLIYSKKKSKK